MGDLVDEVARTNTTLEEIRQAIQQALSQQRISLGANASGETSGGGGGVSKSSRGKTPEAEGLSGDLGEKLGRALSGGVSGLGSFAKSQISEGAGGGLAGSGAGAAFDLFLKGVSNVQQGRNAAIGATPLFSDQSFVDRAASFGSQRGFDDFFGKTLGLESIPLIGDVIANDRRKIDETEARARTPVERAAQGLQNFARQVGEQGGDVDLDAFREIAPLEIARQKRGFDAEVAVRQIVTSFGASDPSSSQQLRGSN